MVTTSTPARCEQCDWPLEGAEVGASHCRSCVPLPRPHAPSIRRPAALVLSWLAQVLIPLVGAAALSLIWNASSAMVPIETDAELGALVVLPAVVGIAIGCFLRSRRAAPGPWWERRFVYAMIGVVFLTYSATALLRMVI